MDSRKAQGLPPRKLDTLRAHMAAGRWRDALKLAASFADLGEEDKPIRQGWEAMARPEFQRALKRDPQALVDAAIAALHRRYDEKAEA